MLCHFVSRRRCRIFSPIKADRWSTGQVLLYLLSEFRKEDTVLRTTARKLTAHDPDKHSSMLQVAASLSDVANVAVEKKASGSRFLQDTVEVHVPGCTPVKIITASLSVIIGSLGGSVSFSPQAVSTDHRCRDAKGGSPGAFTFLEVVQHQDQDRRTWDTHPQPAGLLVCSGYDDVVSMPSTRSSPGCAFARSPVDIELVAMIDLMSYQLPISQGAIVLVQVCSTDVA
jgi:hypothetical protein